MNLPRRVRPQSLQTLTPFFAPKSIAVIGASRHPGKIGHIVIKNLIQGGYQGKIIPVNPNAEEILGLPSHRLLVEAETPVDLAIVVVPAAAVLSALNDCARCGVKAVIVLAAGFREIGPKGAKREAKAAAFCREHNIRLLGPNCLGLIDTAANLNASFARQRP